MPSVWDHRLAELVKLVTGRREGAGLELVPDCLPVLPLLDPADPEYAFLRGERYWGGWDQQAASPGNYSFVGLRNPAGSGHLAVVLYADAFATAGAQVLLCMDDNAATAWGTNLSTPLPLDARDARHRGGSGSTAACVMGHSASAAAVSAPGPTVVRLDNAATGANVAARPLITSPIVIAPGYRVFVGLGTVNTGLLVNMVWEERAVVTPDELTRR